MTGPTTVVLLCLLVSAALVTSSCAGTGSATEAPGLAVLNIDSQVELEPVDYELRVLRQQYVVAAFTRLGNDRIARYSDKPTRLADELRLENSLQPAEVAIETLRGLVVAKGNGNDRIRVAELFHTQYVEAQADLVDLLRAALTPGSAQLSQLAQSIVLGQFSLGASVDVSKAKDAIQQLTKDLAYADAYHKDFDAIACSLQPAAMTPPATHASREAIEVHKHATAFCNRIKPHTEISQHPESATWVAAWKGINCQLQHAKEQLETSIKQSGSGTKLATIILAGPEGSRCEPKAPVPSKTLPAKGQA